MKIIYMIDNTNSSYQQLISRLYFYLGTTDNNIQSSVPYFMPVMPLSDIKNRMFVTLRIELHKISYLATSLFSPPKATTVRTELSTSSATAPASLYDSNSFAVSELWT